MRIFQTVHVLCALFAAGTIYGTSSRWFHFRLSLFGKLFFSAARAKPFRSIQFHFFTCCEGIQINFEGTTKSLSNSESITKKKLPIGLVTPTQEPWNQLSQASQQIMKLEIKCTIVLIVCSHWNEISRILCVATYRLPWGLLQMHHNLLGSSS